MIVSTAPGKDQAGGRIFFSNASRSLVEEDEIELTSVGVDIGSSTSHMLISRIVLERLDTRYIVAEREILFESEIMLTPYAKGEDIDADRLSAFIAEQYAASGIDRSTVDTGALILTGVAVRRRNARAIGDVFAAEAGKFVAVSAGDALETVMSAHGSGALALSEETDGTLTNIDIGGGTTKIAVCRRGRIVGTTVVEAGARLIAFDAQGSIARLEPFGKAYLEALGLPAQAGAQIGDAERARIAELMADAILAAASGETAAQWLRLPPIDPPLPLERVSFSGGVSEYFYERENRGFADLGPDLARALRARLEAKAIPIARAAQGIRATVVGASQYTMQVSGSTIFLDPEDILPVRNMQVIKPALDLSAEELDTNAVATAVCAELVRFELSSGDMPVAVALSWDGSASFARLDALARGLDRGLAPILDHGHPLTVVMDGDVGGLFGIHCRENLDRSNAVISIDGIELRAFDFIDIGEVLKATGSVPVVVKSLVFPGQ